MQSTSEGKDTPHIWLPTTTTKVTVVDGVVTTWDEMEMERRPITKKTGFASKETIEKSAPQP